MVKENMYIQNKLTKLDTSADIFSWLGLWGARLGRYKAFDSGFNVLDLSEDDRDSKGLKWQDNYTSVFFPRQ